MNREFKIDIDDIKNKLEKYNDYSVKEVTEIDNTYSLIAIINNAFFDSYYYIKRNSEDKILYRLIIE